MSQLVFVHGVATRPDDNYHQDLRNRDTLFTEVAFAGRQLAIRNALRGDLAQKWAWQQSSLPSRADRKSIESFSLAEGIGVPDPAGDEQMLAAMAKIDPAAAVDTLLAALVESRGEAGDDDDDAVEPIDAADDTAFVEAARASIESPAAYAFGDHLADAAAWIAHRSRNLVSTGLVDVFRDDLNPLVARFMGDIFVYLQDGPQRQAIQDRIRPCLVDAHQAAQANGEALVAIGHSLGGVILYDMLSDPGGAGLPANLEVDVLATVGSQVGVFEEFKLYAGSDSQIPRPERAKVPAPARIGHWINVFDPVDLLSFRCEPIFEGVKDYQFSSGTGLISAHGAYFQRPRFFARLKARLDKIAAT